MREGVFDKLIEHIYLVPFGYETYITNEARRLLRFVRNETASHIKFAPDHFVVDKSAPENVYLMEFKCTRTPLYSPRRIGMLQRKASDSTLTAETIGQMEQGPYENYSRLRQMNVKVAILNYCAYANQRLLCEFVERIKVIHHDIVQLPTVRGSRTPFINFDLRSMRSVEDFFLEEHSKLRRELLSKYVSDTIHKLEEKMPVIYANR